jgi:hypothetical protein
MTLIKIKKPSSAFILVVLKEDKKGRKQNVIMDSILKNSGV